MRKLSVRQARRTWKVRLSGAAFVLAAVSCAVFFPSFPSSAETSPVMAEDQWLLSVYQKGKEAYDRGNYQAATAEWDKLNTVIDRYPAFKTVIDYLRGRAKTITPGDTEEVDRKLAERTRRIQEIFQKGKSFYDKDDLGRATEEWQKLASYLPEDSPDRQVLADLKKYHEASKEKPAPKRSAALDPEEAAKMHDFLETAAEDLKKKADQIKNAVGNDDARDQNAVRDSFEKAKWLYFQGNTEDAVAELDRLSSLLPQNAAERRSIEKLMLAHRQSRDLQKEADEALAKKEVRYSPPAGLSDFIEQARSKFAAQVKESETQRQASEKIVTDRRSWASEDVQKARKLFEEGKTDAAIQLWEKTAANFQNGEALRASIQQLKAEYESSLMAQQAAQDAEARKDGKLRGPEDFVKTLQELESRLKTQTDSAQSRKAKAEREVIDKNAFVSEGFAKGRSFYDEGKISEALDAWSPIVAGLEEETKLRTLLQEAQRADRDLQTARKAADDADGARNLKLSAPTEMEALLTDAVQKLKRASEAADAERRSAEKYLSDRQNMVNNTFDRGRELFDAGKFSEAVKEWGAMTAELADAEKLKSQMQAIETAYESSLTAQQAAKDAEAKKDARLAPPPGLMDLLAELEIKIKSQADSAASRREAAEKEIAEQRAKADEIFAKGKVAADQGRLSEAFKEWEALLPYLKEGSEVRVSMENLAADHESALKAQRAASDAEARKGAKLETPPELVQALGDISARTKVEAQLAAEKQKKADAVLEDRRTLVRNTYLKGKAFFDEGQFAAAVGEWSSILSNLEEGSKLGPLVEQASEDVQSLAALQKAAEEAEGQKDAKLKTPEGFVAILEDANARLKVQTAETEEKRKKSEQYLAERQRQLDETIAKGNAHFEQGRWEEARAVWMSVLPSLEDPAGFQSVVADLEKAHQERQSVQKKFLEADAWKDAKFKTPGDISKELAGTRERLLSQTQDAERAKQKAVQALAERQAEVQEKFDHGKKLYWDGKIAEAVQNWAAIAPLLEDSEMKVSIQAVAANYENLLKLQQDAQEADLKKESKLKTPEELPRLLGDAKQIIASQTQYAETQKKLADQTFVDRQSLINGTFQKGKTLYEQDRIPEALDEWATIAPYLEKGSQLKEFIDGVARNYQESQIAKKVAEEAEVKKSIKFRTPEDLSKLLEEASQKLNAQTEDSVTQKEVAEKTRADRQAFIDKNFEKGRILYEKGDISGAVDAWTALIPYIEDDAKIRQLILKVEENRRALKQASAEAVIAPAEAPPPAVPDDFERLLRESNEKLEKKTGEKGREKLEADVRQVIQDKKTTARKADKKSVKSAAPIPMDEIEQMMIEYNVATPTEIEKRHQELKAAVK